MMTPFCWAADGILHPVRSATASAAAMIDGRIPLPSSALRLTRIRVFSHQRRGSVTVARYTFYNVATGRCGFLGNARRIARPAGPGDGWRKVEMAGTADALVIGSGPNGLAAAIRLAQAGREVAVYEAAATVGGGARSAELTLPGFVHDPFAAVFPIAVASPFYQTLGLERHGLTWIEPLVPLAHPLDDGGAVVLFRSVQQTAAGLGSDRDVYRRLM